MLVLKTPFDLTVEQREALRDELKERTGEDCIILTNGLQLEEVRLGKEHLWWRRLFRQI